MRVEVDIKNCPEGCPDRAGFIVARAEKNLCAYKVEYWYYGFYTDVQTAMRVAKEVDGVLFEYEPVNSQPEKVDLPPVTANLHPEDYRKLNKSINDLNRTIADINELWGVH